MWCWCDCFLFLFPAAESGDESVPTRLPSTHTSNRKQHKHMEKPLISMILKKTWMLHFECCKTCCQKRGFFLPLFENFLWENGGYLCFFQFLHDSLHIAAFTPVKISSCIYLNVYELWTLQRLCKNWLQLNRFKCSAGTELPKTRSLTWFLV